MKAELEAKLIEKYPSLFRDIYCSPQKSCMAFGIECQEGWYNLIDQACKKIIDLNEEDIYFTQIKEKYGLLFMYVNSYPDEINDILVWAETASSEVCEACGQPGETRGTGWLKTLCDKCQKEKDEKYKVK